MSSNVWIESILRNIPTFLGVYSSDDIPPPIFSRSSCILNFSGKNDIGTHFVVILYSRYFCTYFDPLNLDFIPETIKNYMHLHYFDHFRYIKIKIQHTLSNFCGLYCMFVCILQYMGKPIYTTLNNLFPSPKLSNDEKLVKLLCKTLRKIYTNK